MIPAPGPLPLNRFEWPAGRPLHRVHDERFGATAFNPCLGQPTRFAPLRTAAGECVPTLYAASSFEAAVFETAFHDVPLVPRPARVAFQRLRPLRHTVFRAARPLRLVPLFEPELNALGLTRGQLTATTADRYGETVRWAAAIHAADGEADGLVWTSSRCDPELAMLLFGPRLGEGILSADGGRRLAAPETVAEIRRFGLRAGITIVV